MQRVELCTEVSVGTTDKPVEVVVVEPFPFLRKALADVGPRSGIAVVGEAADLSGALRVIRRTGAGAVLTEAHLRTNGEGVRLCSQLKAQPDPPFVIVHTADNSARLVAECLAAGVDGFVHKSAEPEILAETVMRVSRQSRAWFLGEADPGKAVDVKGLRLTVREQEVLTLVMARLSNVEIAEQLHLARQTVKNYVCSVMRKMDIGTRRELFELVRMNEGMCASVQFCGTAGHQDEQTPNGVAEISRDEVSLRGA